MTPIAPVRLHVRAAARGEIVVLDLDHAQLSFARRLLSKRQLRRLVRSDELHAHFPVFPQHLVDGVFDASDLIGGQLLVEIDRRRRRAKVEAHGFCARPRARTPQTGGAALCAAACDRSAGSSRRGPAPASSSRARDPRGGRWCRLPARRRQRRWPRRGCRYRRAGRRTSGRTPCGRGRSSSDRPGGALRGRQRRIRPGTRPCSRDVQTTWATNGSFIPASSNPRARSTQLSQRPQGSPGGSGS